MSQQIVSTWDGVANTNSWVHDGDVERSAVDIVELASSVAGYSAGAQAAADAASGYADTASAAVASIGTAATDAVQAVQDEGTAQMSALVDAGGVQSALIGSAGAAQIADIVTSGGVVTSAIADAGSAEIADIVSAGGAQVALVSAAGTSATGDLAAVTAAQSAALVSAGGYQSGLIATAGSAQIAAVQAEGGTQIAAVQLAASAQVSSATVAAMSAGATASTAQGAASAASGYAVSAGSFVAVTSGYMVSAGGYATSAGSAADAASGYALTASSYMTSAGGYASAASDSANAAAASAASIAANAEGIARLNGASYQLKCFGDATSFPSSIGGNIYKCTEKLIPAETVLRSVEIQASTANVSGYLFILDADDVIVDKYFLPATQAGWNTIAVNKRYKQDVYIAVRSMATYYTYRTVAASDMYSVGLMEANGDSYGGRTIGQSIPFTQNVPARYYQFAVKINLASIGVAGLTEELLGISKPSDFILPHMAKTGEQGYSLFGKWYRMTDTQSQCASCGGASIAFTVKGATTVSVDIEQLVYHNDPAYMMAEEPYIAYSVDGAAFTRVQIATDSESSVKTISIPSTAEHFVWIVIDGMCQSSGGANRSTGWSGVYIKSLTSDGTMYKVRPKGRQILYVGDSMVEGINTLGTDSLSSSNSNTAEWSFKSALTLHAFPLMQGYGGSTTWTGDSFELYSRPDYSQDTYIVNNQPDVIVCEYGHNDFSLVNAGTKTEAEFIEQYRKLAADLSGHYPGIPVVFLIPFAQRLSNAIRTVASTYQYYYVVETYGYDYQTLDGTHPSAASGTAMAGSFADDMVRLLGKAFFA